MSHKTCIKMLIVVNSHFRECTPLVSLLPPQLIEELQSLSDKTNISISELLEISVISLLKKMNSTTEPKIFGANN
ncbi:ribbon-helix-helix domain-containing protein [Peribacillus sp. NPDC096379]|uniref:ribbon-helix-helix domain-containing protein n=1 Tax=Peribacillus sp. NPDC096379 TaxID=3364393 RepID=UPI00382F5AD6